ncbi:protein Aatf [Lutzomyia longipalpis]|uniref:protein Aatf n=1 Tax=Lutzomyia longipalpis TaxID=7200 RepID=UPI00248442C2|nr:protein Aatf [Lutzomyia longipalpis]XP_055688220.1 protein Aatf [Lutzomyia longipalpis]XP_055688221.1 protein Aatf [Lutzomyia longipalpis]
MSKKVKNKSISEEISSLFTRQTLTEPDSDEGEVNLAKSAEVEEENQLGGIRKQNAPLLEEINAKYKGIPSSRDLDSDSSFDDEVVEDEEDDSEDNDEEDSQDDDEEEEEDDEEESAQSSDESEEISSGEEDTQPGNTQNIKLISQKPTETISKGLCVKNQLKMWENLLQIRIRAQSLMTLSNRLPFPENFQEFKETSEDFSSLASEVQQNVTSVVNQLIDAQNILLTNFPDTKDSLKRGLFEKVNHEDDDDGKPSSKKAKLEFSSKSSCESFRKLYRGTIEKWGERTKSSKGEKLSDTVLSEIDKALALKDNLRASSRICRGNYNLFHDSYGEIDEESGKKTSPEVYDDMDFYHEILSDLIEAKSSQNLNSTAASYLQKRAKNSVKKIVDTKASKGRRIRYVVHKKMVNFMAPNPYSSWSEEAKDELFSSIFGSGASGQA